MEKRSTDRTGKPNIVFIVVDALRADSYSYSQAQNINKLGSEGTVFTEAFSCTNTTFPSLTSILSGKHPKNHGIIAYGVLEDRSKLANITFLPEILKSYGYHTAAICWLGKWLKRGYDEYTSIRQQSKRFNFLNYLVKAIRVLQSRYPSLRWNWLYGLKSHLNIPLYPTADVITQYAQKIVRMSANASKPFFLFIHYFDTHTPYNPPSKYIEENNNFNDLTVNDVLSQINGLKWKAYLESWLGSAESVGEVISWYRGEFAFVDEQVGRLVDTLKEQGIFEDTLFVLTSDHGESLTEHGIYFDHHGLYDATMRVPLIFSGVGFPRGSVIEGLVQHIDIVPTLLKMLNLDRRINSDGKNLLPLIEGEVQHLHKSIFFEEAHTERKMAIRNRKYKYILAPSLDDAICKSCGIIHSGELEELYDLENDPEEKRNLAKDKVGIKNALKDQLLKWFSTYEEVKEKEKRAYVTDEEDEIKERLRRLGYF